MAKTSYQLIPAEFDLAYKKTLQSGDRFTFPRVYRKTLFLSRNRKKGLTQKSLIPILSPVWQALTLQQQTAWNNAGIVAGMSGFKLFVRDKSLRIANDIDGYAIPNLLYQTAVGTLKIEGPATSLKIQQLHPKEYWVSRKVRGTRSQYEPKKIIEDFAIPLQIGINYKSNLLQYGGTAKARFYCIVYSHYQGLTFENIIEIPFDLQQDWKNVNATISKVIGKDRGYTAFIELENVRGTLYIDNIELVHSGQNWCRDPHTLNINQEFTKAFYQIPKHWGAIDVSEGAFYETLYYNVDI